MCKQLEGPLMVWDDRLKKHVREEDYQRIIPYARVPMDWLEEATDCGTYAVTVGVLLWHIVGKKRSATVKLGNSTLERMHVDRRRKYDALCRMREAGLIEVEFRQRKSPIVTVIHREAGK